MAKQQSKQQPAAAKKVEAKKETILTPFIPETLAKKIFLGFAAGLLLLMVSVSHNYGVSGDENFHREYGHHIINFYTSFGKDTTAASSSNNGPDSLMVFYGGLYDGTATILSKALPSINEWNVRHFWNSVFGFIAMLCAGLVAVEVAGWQAGLITLVFMAFSPRFFGESMNNPKDITMAAGYMLTYVFILKFLKQLPRPTIKTTIGLGISIGIAMGIRIGGLLLIPYLFLFWGLGMLSQFGFSKLFDFSKFKENVWPSLKYVLMASVLGYCFSLILWPYGLVNPLTHPLEALGIAQKFPVRIGFLFNGQQLQSTQVPWNYEPQWFAITTPLFGLIGLALSFVLIPAMRKNGKFLMLAFLYFTLLFPIAYVIYKHAVLYDTMRHFFFVYPSIIILAGLTFSYLFDSISKNGKYVLLVVTIMLVILPARFMFANHPNEYVYFNELEGGIKGAYGNYETDYYMNSVKQCADWMKEHEDLKRRRPDGGKLRIYSNAVAPTNAYFKDDTNVSCGYINYRVRNEKDADYEILYNRFIDRELLLNGCFPPEQAVYTVYADGVPLSCVVKKTDKSDYLAVEAMRRNDFEAAVNLLEPYCQKYPKADQALSSLGLAYLQTARTDPTRVQKAINALSQCLNLNKENMNAIYYLSIAYEMSGNKAQADYLKDMLRKMQGQ
jgi:Dolichyl-phosphate-mannose-protein mannosyltransferase